MRSPRTALLLSVLVAASSARSALAQPSPPAVAPPRTATLLAPARAEPPSPPAAAPPHTATLLAPARAEPPSPYTATFAAPVVPASPPLPVSFDFAAPRAQVASLGPLYALPVFPRVSAHNAGSGLRLGGTIVLSLGLATMMGAGIAAIIAGASSIDLDEECPGKVCVEGTRGADKLDRTRDAARATDWLLGIGMPVVTSGAVMLMYSAALSRRGSASIPPPVLRAGPGGGSLTFHF